MGQGDHTKTFLLEALCCQSAPSWLKVRGGWWPVRFYCHLLGLGVFSIPISQAQAQSQSLDNKPWISSIISSYTKLGLHCLEAWYCQNKISCYAVIIRYKIRHWSYSNDSDVKTASKMTWILFQLDKFADQGQGVVTKLGRGEGNLKKIRF